MLMVGTRLHSVDVNAVFNRGIDNMGNTVNTLECGIIGDIYNTIIYSPCQTGKRSAHHLRPLPHRIFYSQLAMILTLVHFGLS